MNTQHDDQVKKQEALGDAQAKEREQLQEAQKVETDEEKVRLEKVAENARLAKEAAEKEALERAGVEKMADDEASSLG